MHKENRPFALSIAGFDPSGGAGILADIKTFEQLNVQGLAVITANTLQTEDVFFRLQWVGVTEVIEAIDVLMSQYPIAVVKIGIVPNSNYLSEIISAILTRNPEAKIIWDPVLQSSSGRSFFEDKDMENLKYILPLIYLLTPNYTEYVKLNSIMVLKELTTVFLKGGHRQEALGEDVLITDTERFIFQSEENITTAKHGSGCVLSSAIVALLTKGYTLEDACLQGKQYTAAFLKSNSSLLGYHHE